MAWTECSSACRGPSEGGDIIFITSAIVWSQVKQQGGNTIRDQIANTRSIIEKTREFQKNIYFHFTDYAKAFDCVDHNKLWKILKEMEYQTTWPASWEVCMQVKKQQLELDMEEQTGSK